MRKLELYRIAVANVAEITKEYETQKEKFLDGQRDYLIKINDTASEIRDGFEGKRTFLERLKEGLAFAFRSDETSHKDEVKNLNDVLRRTKNYLNIIRDIESSEEKLSSLKIKLEMLEEQAVIQERITFINALPYNNGLTVEQKMNELIVADESKSLTNLTPVRQQFLLKCLAYTKDLMKNASDDFLNIVAVDLYESIKEVENIDELMTGNGLNEISSTVHSSITVALMENNLAIENKMDEEYCVFYYEEIFNETGWSREYGMNEYVDINGIVDSEIPAHQIIATEIFNRIEVLNHSYDVVRGYIDRMSERERKDIYIMQELDYKTKYNNNLEIGKIKRYIGYNLLSSKELGLSNTIINESIEEAEESRMA